LFVPGTRTSWIDKAIASGADAIILDLEDSVPPAGKAMARADVKVALAEFADADVIRLVRTNGWSTGQLVADLVSIVGPGLDGICLPKADSAVQVQSLALVLEEFELQRGLPTGEIEIFPTLETARGMKDAFEICASSPRVKRISGVTHSSPNGDYYLAMGSRWDPSGIETLVSGQQIVMAGRAAGLESIICGPVTAISDLRHVHATIERGRKFGANAGMVIHPSHVPIINEIFSPTLEEIALAQAIVAAMAEAATRGEAVCTVDETMVDLAHLKNSEEVIRRARAAGQFP
jgi:citrate lyase subunit beta/citryl-CoA lyase